MIKPEVLDALVAAGCTAQQIAAAVKADQAASSGAERQARYRARGGGKIPPDMRLAVFERDGHQCLECGAQDNLCADHAIPVSKGGETTFENLQTLCTPCNSRKKDRIRKYEKRNSEDVRGHSKDTPPPLIPPDKEIPPKPPKEINPPISPQPRRAADANLAEFGEWYDLFPNKVGKAAAVKAFASARKRASFEEIMAGLRRYVAKRDDRPWCNPSTWLGQDRWEDQPTSGSAPPLQQIDWGKRMDYYERNGTWAPAWGPKPGEVGCKAPINGRSGMATSSPRNTDTTSALNGYETLTH